ncbi:MAG: hypothetical protein J6Z50_07365 [Fibrobacterales bacterium]|nr:hypothetical protein [Fibrobacterales bacterium]
MKKLLGIALALAAAALIGCGDDSSSGPDNGGKGGSASDNVKKQQALQQAAEMQAAIAQAIATGDYSGLDQYGIDEDCVQDSVCLKGKIAEGLDEIGIPGLSGECMLDAACFQNWSDSVAASVSWAFSGNNDYDNGCSYAGAGMVCEEILWNSSDTAAARKGAQECAALQSSYVAQYGELSVGPCNKKKNKCTLESGKDRQLAYFSAQYGTNDMVCQDVGGDGEGGEGGNGSTEPMKNGAYMHQNSADYQCIELYDDPDYVADMVNMGIYESGKCGSEFTIACEKDFNNDGGYMQTKLSANSLWDCYGNRVGDDGGWSGSEGDDGDDDDEYAWGYLEGADMGYCQEVHTLASQVGGNGIYKAGRCPSKYSVACELEGDPEESSEQWKLTPSAVVTCDDLQ